jgi:hypothetical protein
VNCPTTRYSTPAAVPRTGRGESALPRQNPGAKTQSLPFAALPHQLRKDPRLKGNRTAIVLAAALLEYARASDSCWPSNRRLAEDLGCCPQTIRNALAALQAAGWVRVEHGASNPTGRVIWLTWRAKQATPPNRLDPPLKPAGGPPLKPVRPEAKIVVVEKQEEEFRKFAHKRLRPETPPTPIPDPKHFAVPTPLRALLIAPDCRPDNPSGARPIPQPEVAESLAPSPQEPTLPPRAGSPPPLPVPAPPAHEVRPRAARPLLGMSPAGSSTISTSGAALSPAQAIPLTPEQQARLDAMPAASRDQVLLWLATGDPVLVAEARSKLAPPRPRPETPTTLPELLGRIREDPSYPTLAAAGLAAALQDQKSYSGYLRRCEEAWCGELSPNRLLSAYEQAMGPKARNRGAIFMVAVRQKE